MPGVSSSFTPELNSVGWPACPSLPGPFSCSAPKVPCPWAPWAEANLDDDLPFKWVTHKSLDQLLLTVLTPQSREGAASSSEGKKWPRLFEVHRAGRWGLCLVSVRAKCPLRTQKPPEQNWETRVQSWLGHHMKQQNCKYKPFMPSPVNILEQQIYFLIRKPCGSSF